MKVDGGQAAVKNVGMPKRHREMLITLGVSVALLVAALVVILVLLWWHQERIVFQPGGPPFPSGYGAERFAYRADDGQELFAYVLGLERTAAAPHTPGAVIAFHGNADLAAWLIPWGTEVARRTGRIVVLPEYRGYGGLPGTPAVEGVRRDARAALALVHDSLRVDPARVALFGHSLGTAVAVELAAGVAGAEKPERLVLQAPFTSARDMGLRIIARPLELVWGFISRVHYDTEALVRALEVPVWVIHGERDFVVPARMGERVFAAAKVKGGLLLVGDAGHNDVAEIAGEEYWLWLERALAN
jgi:uncharacterized protein